MDRLEAKHKQRKRWHRNDQQVGTDQPPVPLNVATDDASGQCNDCGCRSDHRCDQLNEEPVNEGEDVSVKSEEELASSASISQHVADEFNVIESVNSFQ